MPFPQTAPNQIPQGPALLLPDAFSPENRSRLSGPALRTFLNIAALWQLKEREKLAILGNHPRSTFHKWVADAQAGRSLRLPFDTLIRLSAVLGIHKALQIVYLTPQEGVAWLRAPNAGPLFGGQTPLDLVTSGYQDAILDVRRYLDARRGGLFAAPTDAPFENEPWQADDIVIVE